MACGDAQPTVGGIPLADAEVGANDNKRHDGEQRGVATTDDRELLSLYVGSARRDGLQRLQAEHPEAYDRLYSDLKSRRAERKIQKAKSRETTRSLSRLIYEGATLEDIAAGDGRTVNAVRCSLRSRGIYSEQRASARRVGAWVDLNRADALDRLAADRGTSREQTIEDLLTFALDDDANIARRILRAPRRAAK